MAKNSGSMMLSKRRTRPREMLNKPTAIGPKRVGKAKRPKCIDLSRPTLAQNQLPADRAALKKLFSTKRRIVVISGAGISVNAGSNILIYYIVPDFRTPSGRNSSRNRFDVSVNNSEESYQRFHTMISDMLECASKAKPTTSFTG
jgi:hypothetical protein